MNSLRSPDLLEAAAAGDNEACERLLEENAGLIWSVVRRYYGRGADSEDLYQLGCLGFVKAVRGFNPTFGTQFSTYAVPKIAGEIRRFLRDDGTVKVSRGVKERALTIRLARDQLGHVLGREPTVTELAAETGFDPEEIAAAETATMSALSLQGESGEDGFALEDVLGSDGMEEELLERVALREAIDSLSERERMVIGLRFYKNLTQEKCSRILGVSQVQVSRIERKAVQKLREKLREDD